nr:YadA family autotransporter adhesin [Dyella terrae]
MSVADRNNTISVGSSSNLRQVVNMAAGTQDTDAVNVSQLMPVVTALGGGAAFNATTGAVTGPSYALTNANTIAGTTGAATNVGTGFSKVDAALGTLNTQVTQNTSDIAGNTTSISNLDGRVTQNTTDITNLQNNISTGTVGLVQQAAAGANLTVGKDTDGVAVDFADKNGATRTLKNVTAGVADTDAVNMSQLNATNANVTQNTSDIAGNTTSISNLDNRVTTNEGDISTINSTINTMNGQLGDAVMYDSAAHDKVTLGNAGTPVQLTNIKNGDLSASSSDAVNGSQLYATNQQVAQNTSDIAGNTTSISNITNQINSGTIGLVQQASAGANLTVGKDTDGAAVDFAGTAGARKLINVADGTVADGSLDAVNGGQLHGVSQSVANAIGGGSTVNGDGSISAPSYTVTNVDGSTSTVNNVGDAITNIDGRTYGNTTAINNVTNQINSGTIGLVQQASAGANLTVGKDTDGAAVDFAGTAGARKLINVADGTVADGSLDAVNGGQLHGVSQSVANAIGGGSTVNSDGSISAPSYTVTNNDGSTSTVNNVGDAITNLDGRTYSNTTAITDLSQTIDNITNNGAGIKYFHSNSTQADSVASGVNAVAVGGNALASASNAVAVGSGAQATQANSVALGSGSTTSTVTATTGATIAGTSYTYAGGTPTGTVSVGSAGSERTVTNVAAGQVSATSTDAVNGSQLYATNQAVNQLDGRMGNVENNLSNVTNTVNTITNNMSSGQSGMFQVSAESNSTQPVASGTRSTAGGNGAVASGAGSTAVGNGAQATGSNSVAIGTDSVADRDNSVSVGSAGKERQITNVAAGKADTDAVNVSQLKSAGVINGDGSTNKTVTYDNNTDGSTSVTMNSGGDPAIIHNVAAGQVSSDAATVGQVNDAMQQTANWAKNYTDHQVANVSRQARAGSASAIAVASLPQAYQPGQNSAGVAFGTYQGQSAVSIGMSAISESGRYIFKVSATGAQHSGAGAGIGAGMVW